MVTTNQDYGRMLDTWLAWAARSRIPKADLDERDPDYIRETLPGLWMLASYYFRADVRGLDRIPAEGPVLLVGNHSGGTLIAAVRHGGGASRVVTIDVATGTTTEVADSTGAQGNLVWARDSEHFAFVRVDPEDNLQLQAVVCEVNGSCEPGFSWSEGVLLLGFATT